MHWYTMDIIQKWKYPNSHGKGCVLQYQHKIWWIKNNLVQQISYKDNATESIATEYLLW